MRRIICFVRGRFNARSRTRRIILEDINIHFSKYHSMTYSARVYSEYEGNVGKVWEKIARSKFTENSSRGD